MKRKLKRSLKIFLSLILFGTTVFFAGYFYLNSLLNKTTVSENLNSVPYYTSIPENANVLMNICEDKIILSLDFKEESLTVTFADNGAVAYGYTVDYTVNCDYETVGYLVDLAGGIEFENTRYTGTQITKTLEFSNTDGNFKRAVAKGIIKGIAENGITKEDLLYLIEICDTDLKFNECFFWIEFLPRVFKFVRFAN